MLSRDQIKQQASRLKEFLNQKDSTISHSTCLLAVAKMHGYADWNIMSAALKKQESQPALNKFVPESYHNRNKKMSTCDFETAEAVDDVLVRFTELAFKANKFPEKIEIRTDDFGDMLEFVVTSGNTEVYVSAPKRDNQEIMSDVQIMSQEELERVIHSAIEGDVESVIRYAQERNNKISGNNQHSLEKSKPRISFNDINLDRHPKLKELQSFIERQNPTYDPRIHLLEVKTILANRYGISWGDAHIQISSHNTLIATISAGINTGI